MKNIKQKVHTVSIQGRLKGILDQNDNGLPMPELTEPALNILKSRYLLKNNKGEIIESPQELFLRVAKAIAEVESCFNTSKEEIEKLTLEFYDLLSSLRFLPNSPTLMNAGKHNGQLSACFVLPVDDSLDSVFLTLKDAALIHKSGGGTGFSFGRLRPAGDIINTSGGNAVGPVGVLTLYNSATDIVKQGGTRRGANMGVLPVSHPDIFRFIEAKKNGEIKNFNLSIAVTDAFMRAVKDNSSFQLINPRTQRVVKEVKAKKIWNSIIENAWLTGDPGLLFIDTINGKNPTPEFGSFETTNPCGEQPLLPYESCNLGSMNLLAYVKNGKIDWLSLEKDIILSVRFLDNVIEANTYPLVNINEATKRTRKIGLGVMGFADALIKLNIAYDSKRAVIFAEEFMKKFSQIANAASINLLNKNRHELSLVKSKKIRNSTVTTIAPTGTISLIAGVSSGIEPVFSLAHQRIALDGNKFVFIHSELLRLIRVKNLKKSDIYEIFKTGSIQACKKFSKKEKSIFRTALEINALAHLRIQATFQRYCDNGVSKTINLHSDSKKSMISNIYMKSWSLGCKGITIFRQESKNEQVLTSGINVQLNQIVRTSQFLFDDEPNKATKSRLFSNNLAQLSRSKIKKLKKTNR